MYHFYADDWETEQIVRECGCGIAGYIVDEYDISEIIDTSQWSEKAFCRADGSRISKDFATKYQEWRKEIIENYNFEEDALDDFSREIGEHAEWVMLNEFETARDIDILTISNQGEVLSDNLLFSEGSLSMEYWEGNQEKLLYLNGELVYDDISVDDVHNAEDISFYTYTDCEVLSRNQTIKVIELSDGAFLLVISSLWWNDGEVIQGILFDSREDLDRYIKSQTE